MLITTEALLLGQRPILPRCQCTDTGIADDSPVFETEEPSSDARRVEK